MGGAAIVAGVGVAGWRILESDSEDQSDRSSTPSPQSSLDTLDASVSASASTPTSHITAAVGDDGFELALGRVRISAPAGVAAPGTPITLELTNDPVPDEFGAFTIVAGLPIQIVLGDDEQPNTAITIAYDLSETPLASSIAETALPAVTSWSGTAESFELIPSHWDAQTEILTATTDHLTGFWGAIIDIGKFIAQATSEFLGLSYSKPACAFEPLSVGATHYNVSHSGDDPVWPCIGTDRDGRLVVELHSNSDMAWAVESRPSATGTILGDWKDLGVGLASIYQGIFGILGEKRAAVMPGGSVRIPFDPNSREIQISIRQSPVLFIVASTLQAVISVLGALPGGRMAEAVLASFEAFDCITEEINTFYQEESTDIARSVVLTIISCVSAMLENERGPGLNLALRSALAGLGMLSTAANALIGEIQGIVREWTGNASVTYTITTEVPEEPADGSSIDQRGPSLDRPVVVKWRSETYGINYSPPTIDSGTIYLAWMFALDGATGLELWHADPNYTPGGSPVIFDDLVIFHSRDRAGGLVQAFDQRSGTERWRLGGDGPVPGPCAIANGRLWLSFSDILYSVDPATGTDRKEIRKGVGGETYAFNDRVYTSDNATQTVKHGYLVALDAVSGVERWRFPDIVGTTSLVATADSVFAGSQSGRFHAIDAQTGEERWSFDIDEGIWSTPSIADGLIFIDGPSSFSAHSLETGEKQWTFSTGDDRVLSSQAAANGVVYVGGYDYIYALETVSGNEVWRYGIEVDLAESPARVTVEDGMVCAVYGAATVLAFGNLEPVKLAKDVTIRGTPSDTGVVRGTAKAGATISQFDTNDTSSSQSWVLVTVDGVSGWIPFDTIDPATLPPEEEIEYVYVP